MTVPIFNYDESGWRTNNNGNRTSRREDETIVKNLRFRWPNELSAFTDQTLVNEYDDFAYSEMFGDNDALFLEWMEHV